MLAGGRTSATCPYPEALPASLHACIIYDTCHLMLNRPRPPIPEARMPALFRCISRGEALSCRGILSREVGIGRGELVAGAALFISGDESSTDSVFRWSVADSCALCEGMSLRWSVGDGDCIRYGCLLSLFSRGA